jgi:hypothetical protein
MRRVQGTWQQWLAKIAANGPSYAEALRLAVLEDADPTRNLGPALDADHPCFRIMLARRSKTPLPDDVVQIAADSGCSCA